MSVFHTNLAANLSNTLTMASGVFSGGVRECMSFPTEEYNSTQPVTRFRQTVRAMETLLREINNYKGNDPRREPVLTPALYEQLTEKFRGVRQQLQELRQAFETAPEETYSPYPKLNQAVQRFLASSPETWLDQDIQDLMQQRQQAASEIDIQNFLAEVTGNVSLDREPESRQEYLPRERMLPDAVLCSGDIKDIASFYLANRNQMNEGEKEYLKYRLQSLVYIDLLAEKCSHQDKQLTEIRQEGAGITMPNLQLYEHQSSGNGCWSCSYQLLLQSRGVLLDQKLIRAFRPALDSGKTMSISGPSVDSMLGDSIGSPFEMADLTMRLLPNTAMFNTTLSVPTSNMNQGAQDRQNMAAQFDLTVGRALWGHHSPVSLTNGAHFLTIVGRRGSDGKWQIRNSSDNNPTNYNYLSTEELLTWSHDLAVHRQSSLASLQLTWLRDLTPGLDGSCRDLENDGFGRVRFNGFVSEPGTGILNTEGEADSDAELSLEGHNFMNKAGDSMHLQITETLSVPRRLNPDVKLVPQEHFVPGPQFSKWQGQNYGQFRQQPQNKQTVPYKAAQYVDENGEIWEDYRLFEQEDLKASSGSEELWEDYSLFAQEPEKKKAVPEKEKNLLPKETAPLKPLPYMSRNAFQQKLETDREFRELVNLVWGQEVPLWKDPGKAPEPFNEPAPAAPPVHGSLAKFGNWIRKLFTGVDRYAEEQANYQQQTREWEAARQQRELEITAYNQQKISNTGFEQAYAVMENNWKVEQNFELPGYENVRSEFRKATEVRLNAALQNPSPDSLAEICGNVLADKLLANNEDVRREGPAGYRNQLVRTSLELKKAISELFKGDHELLQTVGTLLLTAETPKQREEGIPNLLMGPLKNQRRKEAVMPAPPTRTEKKKITGPERSGF